MFRTRDSNNNVKYISRSKAGVVDNRDPLHRGRVRVYHPILGETSWIDYLRTPGFFTIPAIGDIVYIECDSGENEFPVAWGNVTKGPDENPDVPTKFQRDVPTNRGIQTPGGHSFELDDGIAKDSADPHYRARTTKSRGIRITSSSGHRIHIEDDSENQVQSISIFDNQGDGIIFDAQTKQVTMISKGKTNITSEDTVTIAANKDLQVNVPNDAEIHVVKSFNVTANQTVQIGSGTTADFSGLSGTSLGDSSSTTEVKGSEVNLAGGGPGVARLGDRVFGTGPLGIPVSSTIIQGSTKVKSG